MSMESCIALIRVHTSASFFTEKTFVGVVSSNGFRLTFASEARGLGFAAPAVKGKLEQTKGGTYVRLTKSQFLIPRVIAGVLFLAGLISLSLGAIDAISRGSFSEFKAVSLIVGIGCLGASYVLSHAGDWFSSPTKRIALEASIRCLLESRANESNDSHID